MSLVMVRGGENLVSSVMVGGEPCVLSRGWGRTLCPQSWLGENLVSSVMVEGGGNLVSSVMVGGGGTLCP